MKTSTLKTKAMSILLAIVMLLGMLPMAAHAAETTYYTITYTDGVDGEVIFEDQSYEIAAGESIVYFNTEIASLEREGYVFNGWTPKLETTVTKDVTYTALWNEWIETGYTITYTDGVDGEEIFADQVYTDVTSGAETPAFEGTPTRTGFTFKGWTPDVAATVTGDATYTALWEEIHTHSYSAATCTTPATCSCGATTGGVDSTNHTYAEDDYQNDANGHWQLCSNENCPDADKGKTASTPHIYDGDTDAVCDTCDYTRLILVADKAVVKGNGTVTLTSILPISQLVCSDERYKNYISGSGKNWSFQMKNNVTTELTFTATIGTTTAYCTVSFEQDPNALILTPSSTTLVGNGTITLTANKEITGITCSNQNYESDISGSGANWQLVTNRNANANLRFEATTADGETALCWITFTHTHSYTEILDTTCDCGYNRGLFATNDDGKDFFEVGFISGDGVTLPDDAELVVGEHYPSLAPIASTVVEKTSLGDFRCPEEYDTLTDDDTVLVYGIKCKLYETLVIGGLEYILWGSFQDGAVLLRLLDGRGMVYTGGAWLAGYPDSSFDRTVKQPTNTTVTIDGVTYDVGYILNNSTYILYRDGQLAGMYPSTDDAADLHGSVQFYEGYDPETLKAQQDDSDLGSVTIPADSNNAAIADFAPGKTYKVSVIGSNDISVPGYDDALLDSIKVETEAEKAAKAEVERLKADRDAKRAALDQLDVRDPDHMEAWVAWHEAERAYKEALAALMNQLMNHQKATVTQTFKIPDALVGAKNVKYVAVHDTNPYAADLAEAEQATYNGVFDQQAWNHYFKIKALYDAWEKEHGSGAEYGTVTLSLDGLTLTATHTGVRGFSPFIVYAFVEADEPEYKELSATLVDGNDTTLTWLWITLACVGVAAVGGFAVYWFVIRKRRTANR